MKVAIIGSRDVMPGTDGKILRQLPAGCSEIISGGASGVDLLAKRIAHRLHIRYTCYRPNYKKYGRAAPLIRNNQIIDNADCVLAFWNGRSKGTRHALACCIKKRRPFKIILTNPEYRTIKNQL